MSNIYDAFSTIKHALSGIQNGHVSDIVILLPTIRMGLKAVKRFENEKIEINHIFDENEDEGMYFDEMVKRKRNHKKSFWIKDGRLKMCTIHSFKGWEAPHVIMLIPDRRTWKGEDHDLNAIVYTAITRTRKNLIVLNCNEEYSDFGKEYPSTW